MDPYLADRLVYAVSLTHADQAVGPPSHGQMAKYAVRGWAYGLALAVVAIGLVLLWYVWQVRTFASSDAGFFDRTEEGFDLALLTVALPFLLIAAGYLSYGAGYLANWFVPDRLIAGRWELNIEGPIDTEALQLSIHREFTARAGPYSAKLDHRAHGEREDSRRYVVIDHGKYRAAVSLVAHRGTIWVSWALWRRVFPFALVIEYVVELFWTALGQASLREQLRYSEARAFRECVHNATRAGLDRAISDTVESQPSPLGHDRTDYRER